MWNVSHFGGPPAPSLTQSVYQPPMPASGHDDDQRQAGRELLGRALVGPRLVVVKRAVQEVEDGVALAWIGRVAGWNEDPHVRGGGERRRAHRDVGQAVVDPLRGEHLDRVRGLRGGRRGDHQRQHDEEQPLHRREPTGFIDTGVR